MDIQVGSSAYFVRESSSGFVAGPRQTSDGIPRKITVPIDMETGEVRNVHMKSGHGSEPQESWRIVPVEVLPKIASWISRKSMPLNESEVQQIEHSSYSFSVRRGLVTFQVWQTILDRFVPALARGLDLFRFDVKETEKQIMVRAIIDPSVVVRLARRFSTIPWLVRSSCPGNLPANHETNCKNAHGEIVGHGRGRRQPGLLKDWSRTACRCEV